MTIMVITIQFVVVVLFKMSVLFAVQIVIDMNTIANEQQLWFNVMHISGHTIVKHVFCL